MSKVHLLAGPNNSGKSNVLAVARRVLPELRQNKVPTFADVDEPLGRSSAKGRGFRIAIARHVTEEQFEGIARDHRVGSQLREALEGPTFGPDVRGNLWFEFEVLVDSRGRGATWGVTREQVAELKDCPNDPRRISRLSGALTAHRGDDETDARRVLDHVIDAFQVRPSLPPVATIPAFRQIGPAADNSAIDDEYGGPGLIERLARLQNPDFAHAEDRRRFDRISRFVATLFDDRDAFIEIPHGRQTILVHHGGRRLPLENYGTGLHEVVILAAAATVLVNHLVCIEEPEVHLHPTLQRKLVRYLYEQTDNQYLVATHSAHMLDAERASISAVRQRDGNSEVAPAIAPADVAAISRDLGYRASDLVQSNAVIWVEGPSDRIYVRHWLALLEPSLVEGIHYSLMFYGGSLLRHLSPNDPAVEEFVSLPRINRNFALIVDSDREKRGATLGRTKRRVRSQVSEVGAAVWITRGYTIENYVPPDVLAAAVTSVHPGARTRWRGDPYQNPLASKYLRGRTVVDKTAVAGAVVDAWPGSRPWPFDLKKRVRELANMVLRANADSRL